MEHWDVRYHKPEPVQTVSVSRREVNEKRRKKGRKKAVEVAPVTRSMFFSHMRGKVEDLLKAQLQVRR